MTDSSYDSYDLKYDPEAQRMLECRRQQELATSGQVSAQKESVTPLPTTPAPLTQSQADIPATVTPPTKPPAKKRGRPPSSESASNVYLRDFPREILEVMKRTLPFPELGNQTDFLIAFTLFQLDPGIKFQTYEPPPHIKQAVDRMREVLSGSDIQALGATMGQIRNKMNKFDDEMLQQRMLLAYALTVISGLHAPSKVSTGKDLKLSHENVISTAISALETFPEFKQVIRGYEGRPRRSTARD